MKTRYRRYQIGLLSTADGVNLKKDKTKDAVTVFLWEKNLIDANKSAHKIAEALSFSCNIGMIEYVIVEVKECQVPTVT